MDAFSNTESKILIEPSLSRRTRRPPDLVLIDPEVGVNVIEVKSMKINDVESIEAGGTILLKYRGRTIRNHVIHQVRAAMFDIRVETEGLFSGEFTLHFKYWVCWPSIDRAEWISRFGAHGYCPNEFIFSDEMTRNQILNKLGGTDREMHPTRVIRTVPLDQLQVVWKAFGDNSVLYCQDEERPARAVASESLGGMFDSRSKTYKELSPEQSELSVATWETGPRLVRGVAGSGKTIVLANNIARRTVRLLREQAEGDLYHSKRSPRLLAICFNRTLSPYLLRKIETAFKQRTGRALPAETVTVRSMNQLMYEWSQKGIWKYQQAKNSSSTRRAEAYLSQLKQYKEQSPEGFAELGFDAIYVDEGQDFEQQEYELLSELWRAPVSSETAEPSLFIFYDDAQNLYGRGRPNWASLGLNMRGGRSFIMTTCFRNTAQILQPAFNVLYSNSKGAPNREFGDLATLEEKSLISRDKDHWKIHFATREGKLPIVTLARNKSEELQLLNARLAVLVQKEDVRPQDIIVLTHRKERVHEIAQAIRTSQIFGIHGVHVAIDTKDESLCPIGRVTVSTVASAKGYDAYVVLMLSANEFKTDVRGRAAFYVGCTRASEFLEVFGYADTGLFAEMNLQVNSLR